MPNMMNSKMSMTMKTEQLIRIFTQEGEQLLEDLKTLVNKYRYKEETIDHMNTNFYLFVEYDYHLQENKNI